MKDAARLLAARLLEAEPDVPTEPVPNPADQGIDVRDFILSADNVLYGVPEPHYFIGLEDKLAGKQQVKLDTNTMLVRVAPDVIAIRLHATDILTANRNGQVVVTTYGTPNPKHFYGRNYYGYNAPGYGTAPRQWRSMLTKDRLNKYLPCHWGIYTEGGTRKRSGSMEPSQGHWYWSNRSSRSGYYDGPPFRVVFNDGDTIDTQSGQLIPKEEPVPTKAKGRTWG